MIIRIYSHLHVCSHLTTPMENLSSSFPSIHTLSCLPPSSPTRSLPLIVKHTTSSSCKFFVFIHLHSSPLTPIRVRSEPAVPNRIQTIIMCGPRYSFISIRTHVNLIRLVRLAWASSSSSLHSLVSLNSLASTHTNHIPSQRFLQNQNNSHSRRLPHSPPYSLTPMRIRLSSLTLVRAHSWSCLPVYLHSL
jgi:hypothetical protein